MLFATEVVACICHSPLHHQKPDFEGQPVIKASSYLLPFVLEAHRESLPHSCETSARRLSAESAEVYSTADLSASAAHIPFSGRTKWACFFLVPVPGVSTQCMFAFGECAPGLLGSREHLTESIQYKTVQGPPGQERLQANIYHIL